MTPGLNVIKVIENNLDDQIVALEKRQRTLVVELADVNRELATAYTLAQVVPIMAQPPEQDRAYEALTLVKP